MKTFPSIFYKLVMAAFVKSDLRQTIDYGACYNQYIFDILSKLVDKSNEQVR